MRARRLRALAVGAIAAAAIAAGCGGSDQAEAPPPAATAPASSAAPIVVTPAAPGQVVRAGRDTPKGVAKALAGRGVVVVAFIVPGPADDQAVAAAVRSVRSDKRLSSGVRYFLYTVGRNQFGDLADLLGVTGTPSVAVIARDRTLSNTWTGLIDAQILRQAILDAKATAAANR